MSTKMHSILSVLVILALVALTTAFPSGSGTCNSNATVIEGVMGQPMGKNSASGLGYTFNVTMPNNNYVPGGPAVQFCVHGKDPFNGLLVYAVDNNKNHVGEWMPPSPDYKILYLNCLGDPKGTLTHANPNPKGPNQCFQYMPPSKDVGPIKFIGTVVKNRMEGFQIIVVATIFVVKDSKFVTTATMTTTDCMQQPSYTKPYENTKPPYGTTTYQKPPYQTTYEKPTYMPPTYEMPTYEQTYKPTNSIGDFKPPDVSAANGITYTGFILLLQLMIVSSLIIYYH